MFDCACTPEALLGALLVIGACLCALYAVVSRTPWEWDAHEFAPVVDAVRMANLRRKRPTRIITCATYAMEDLVWDSVLSTGVRYERRMNNRGYVVFYIYDDLDAMKSEAKHET